MPCYDKKLEASRKEFEDTLTLSKDVDLVITSLEVEEMLMQDGVSLADLPLTDLSSVLSSGKF